MPSRVLILSASSGNGHVRAAQALELAFKRAKGVEEVRHVDALQFASLIVRDIYSKAYIKMVNSAPQVLGWLYDAYDKPWINEARRLAFDRLNALPLMKLIVDFKPDIVICTHFLPAELVSWLLCRKRITAVHAIVVTDFDAHAMWLCRHYDQYFVALDETKEHLRKLGVNPHNISISGIPIDPVFAQPKDKQEMRRKYGLAPDLATIIVSAGGFGVGPMEQLMASLAQSRHKIQVIPMCGKNETLKQRLEGFALRCGDGLKLKPIGYINGVDEYMAAADILLGKPGGLTTAEALARGLVFVVFNPIPGQEERNSDHLLEEGVGLRCNNLPTLAYKLDGLLDDKQRMSMMRSSALRLSHPLAAAEIAAKLLQQQPLVHQGTVCGTGHVCYRRSKRRLEQRAGAFRAAA